MSYTELAVMALIIIGVLDMIAIWAAVYLSIKDLKLKTCKHCKKKVESTVMPSGDDLGMCQECGKKRLSSNFYWFGMAGGGK